MPFGPSPSLYDVLIPGFGSLLFPKVILLAIKLYLGTKPFVNSTVKLCDLKACLSVENKLREPVKLDSQLLVHPVL